MLKLNICNVSFFNGDFAPIKDDNKSIFEQKIVIVNFKFLNLSFQAPVLNFIFYSQQLPQGAIGLKLT